ncbi:molybdate transport system substrate-binding protein [Syntrophus gentianae]|uniref:Molybdate transport system substrate-binding protein n=1 Tax=Syntrophus gentianae TaxID=43775 RepID=A0A1H8A2P7_9BACT|nr:substrate-binding domain-containing protein [Syntrophus gentianae]SEM64990.1 molybdate transport system substrate-binding protein [Syntrophus gentianae]
MEKKESGMERRTFLKTVMASTVAAATMTPGLLSAGRFQADSLKVWSCGGLAEAMNPANRIYEKRAGIKIEYTGAFAAALGKSLLGGAVTEVFAGRVLKLAKSLKAAKKMLYFRPLCFTEYVIITPLGNPAGIKSVEDLARPGVPVILPLGASPPGGDAVMGILKKAKIDQAVLKNTVEKESCVIKMMPEIIAGEGKASIVERRMTRMAQFEGKVEVIPIQENFFPPGPLTFTIGVMKYAKDRALADDYVQFMCSDEAQAIFERQGFIPAASEKGRMLIEKLGVRDV